MSFYAHETAVIDHGAQIGTNSKIWHFSHVCSGAAIGSGCSVGQNVFVANNVKIGNHVKIQNNVSVYEGVILEDYTFCGPSMVFTNVKTPRSAFPRNHSSEYQTTRVCHGASIGANATVVCGTTIGAWAFIAAGAVVTKDVPAYGLLAGVPGRLKGWICQCGQTLKFTINLGICAACDRSYERVSDNQIAFLGLKNVE